MEPTLNAAGNLAIPVRFSHHLSAEGRDVFEPSLWAYHIPLGRAVFELNFRAIALAHDAIFAPGQTYAINSGPIIGALELRKAARECAISEGSYQDGVDPSAPLFAELRRNTTILVPKPDAGYLPVGADQALSANAITRDEWGETEAALAFFTCAWWLSRLYRRGPRVEVIAHWLKAQITSSTLTDFADSLATSSSVETSAPQPEIAPTMEGTQAPVPQ